MSLPKVFDPDAMPVFGHAVFLRVDAETVATEPVPENVALTGRRFLKVGAAAAVIPGEK